MSNETQPFDQMTYDAIIHQMHADFPEEYRLKGHGPLNFQIGAEKAARVAARLAARQPAPVVGDEELLRVFERASNESFEGDTFRDYRNLQDTLAGVCAVREALAAQAVQVPELPGDWWLDHLEATFYNEDDSKRIVAKGANLDELWRNAIEQAKGGAE